MVYNNKCKIGDSTDKLTYDWDLTHFYKTEKDVEQDFSKLKDMMISLKDFKGKLNNKDSVLEYFKKND